MSARVRLPCTALAALFSAVLALAAPSGHDNDLAAFIAAAGDSAGAVDSCVKLIATVREEPADSAFDEEHSWIVVTCARWLGLLHGSTSLPELERVLTLRRTAPRDSRVGEFMLRLQEHAYRSRVSLMLESGRRGAITESVLRDYANRGGASVDAVLRDDLRAFSGYVIGERDEFADAFADYGRRELVPIPTLPVPTEADLGKVKELERFSQIATGSSPAKRRAMLGLLTDRNPDVRALGAHVVDLTPESIDTILTLFNAAHGADPALRDALRTLQRGSENMIGALEHDLAQHTEHSPTWEHLRSKLQEYRDRRSRIETSLR